MRTWGRITNPDGSKTWVEVSTDANGDNSQVWLTTLAQTLKLNLNESPFYASYGIPAAQSVIQQVQPDYYVAQTQQQYAQHFAALVIAKQPQQPNQPRPTYQINATTFQGVQLTGPIPT
jgi:hypothetical protein